MGIFTRVPVQEKANFAKSLSVMLESGITINESLKTLSEQTASAHLRKAILHVSHNIENGQLLSDSFAKEVRIFEPVFVSLIRAGEESGTLKENLTFLADWFEHSSDLRREVANATLYPKLVFSASVLLGGGLSVFILPRLAPLFEQLDVELPFITKVLLFISQFVQANWLWLVVVVVFTVTAYSFAKQFSSVRKMVDTLKLSTPFIGPILVQYELAMVTQLFATLLRSGIPLSRAVTIIEDATTNTCFKSSIRTMQTSIDSGLVLSAAMSTLPKLYPKMSVSIIAVGEQSGTLSHSFSYLSQYYAKEVKAKARRLPTLIEPILLIFIALIVGFVALAIIMPIYKVTGSITR